MAAQVRRSFRFRFYPTDDQAAELSRTFGCVRFVYNKMLEERGRAWREERRQISYAESSVLLTEWKKSENFGFLAEVSSVPLQQALRHLQTAFGNFFAQRAAHPRYKSKKASKSSAEYTRSAFTWREGYLKLAKMRSPLDVRWSRLIPAGVSPSTVTVTRDASGRWFVSLLCDATVAPGADASQAVGVDVGLTSLVTLSTGEKVANPRWHRRDRSRLARRQRELSRKAKGSKNREKARRKVARVHARIADRRRDFLHKLSTRLVRENQTIVIEDMPVCSLLKNHSLARAISDAGWAQLRSFLEYKCAWYGRELMVMDRWFPSSKMCKECGVVCEKLPLHVRTWTCDCGATHDRDVNAAKNLLAAGLAASACGAGVRPGWEHLPSRAVGGEAGSSTARAVVTPVDKTGVRSRTTPTTRA